MNIPTGKEAEQLAYASVASGEWNEDFTVAQFAEANPILDGKATIIDWAFFITGQNRNKALDGTFENILYLGEEWEKLSKNQISCVCEKETLTLIEDALGIKDGKFDIFRVDEEEWRLKATVESVRIFNDCEHDIIGENDDYSFVFACDEKLPGKNDTVCICAFDTIWAEASAIAEGE